MRGFTFGQHSAVGCAHQFVAEVNHGLADVLQTRANDDLVIVQRGSLVAATGVDYRDEAVVLLLHIFVRKPKLPEEFHTTDFEPDEMVRMIDDAHLVGFGVTHANARFIDCGERIDGGHVEFAWSGHPCELHLGLRFSRNDEMPSRKSAVERMAAFSRTAASIWVSSSARAAALSRRLVYSRDAGLFSISCAASSRARVINASAATTSFTKPMRCASAASKRRPVSSRSRAIFSPTWRSKNVDTIAGTNPMRTSV